MLDPETAHNLAVTMISRGMVRARVFADDRLRQTLFGIDFPNPLGLAAGFDKNAAAARHWQKLGFGFAELGTITYHAQPGNPKPRLFRLPQHQALINRMGFNNDGAESVALRLNAARPQSRRAIPLGVNLGKSKITPLEEAADDYRRSFEIFAGNSAGGEVGEDLGKDGGKEGGKATGKDEIRHLEPRVQYPTPITQYRSPAYFVVNVSSPNTPGLRTLQEKGPLTEIVRAIRSVDSTRPLFIKVAPDLELPALDDVVEVAHEEKLTGMIATNTTIWREGISGPNAAEQGGLSGAPLRQKSNEFLAHLYETCDREMILIGVGGIFAGADIYEKIALGAHLCQVYTGWIYGGPSSVPRMLSELVGLMERDGIVSLAELRGSRR